MGGAWSCCLPCAGGGGGGGGVAVSGTTPETKKGSALLKHQEQYQQHQQQQQKNQQYEEQKGQQQEQQHYQQQSKTVKRVCVEIKERAPLSDLDEDLDDDFEDDEEKECELRPGEEEDCGKEGGTQHRLSPRLHDIEEEDDEEGRNFRERSVANLVSSDFLIQFTLSSSALSFRVYYPFCSPDIIKNVYTARQCLHKILL